MSVPTEQLRRPRWPALVTEVLGDRVVIALGLGILVLAAIDPPQAMPSCGSRHRAPGLVG